MPGIQVDHIRTVSSRAIITFAIIIGVASLAWTKVVILCVVVIGVVAIGAAINQGKKR